MAAAAPFPISMSEYLHTSYEPHRDYVGGIVAPREMGGPDHEKIQQELLRSINRHAQEWGVHARSSAPEGPIRIDLAAVFAAAEKDRPR